MGLASTCGFSSTFPRFWVDFGSILGAKTTKKHTQNHITNTLKKKKTKKDTLGWIWGFERVHDD